MKSELISLEVATISALFALCAAFMSEGRGGIVVSRGDLVFELGAAAVTEDFESYKFPTNTARRVGTVLDATSVIEGQGPGLVREGVRFMQHDTALEGLQWDRQFQYGLTSAALVTDGQLVIDFTVPVTHVGFDMFWFDVGFPIASPATIQVFASDDVSMLYSTNIFEPYAPDSFFFGFASEGGIGRIILFRDESDSLGVSPIIDNLTFGFIPRLSISLSGGQAKISWPEIAAGYELEATTNLIAQTGWSTVTNVPVSVNGQNSVLLRIAEPCKLFRLHRQ